MRANHYVEDDGSKARAPRADMQPACLQQRAVSGAPGGRHGADGADVFGQKTKTSQMRRYCWRVIKGGATYRFSSQLRTHFIIPLCAPVLALDDVMLPSPNYLTPPPMLSGAAAAEDGKRRRLTESEWKLARMYDMNTPLYCPHKTSLLMDAILTTRGAC